MDLNLANITKLLKDLSSRLSNVKQELKSDRECETGENTSENGPCLENRTSRNNVQTDHDEMNIKNINRGTHFWWSVGSLTFPQLDFRHESLLWLVWYADERKIRVAKMKFVGQTRQYWMNVEKLMRLRNQEATQTWDEMEMKLQEKHLPVPYK